MSLFKLVITTFCLLAFFSPAQAERSVKMIEGLDGITIQLKNLAIDHWIQDAQDQKFLSSLIRQFGHKKFQIKAMTDSQKTYIQVEKSRFVFSALDNDAFYVNGKKAYPKMGLRKYVNLALHTLDLHKKSNAQSIIELILPPARAGVVIASALGAGAVIAALTYGHHAESTNQAHKKDADNLWKYALELDTRCNFDRRAGVPWYRSQSRTTFARLKQSTSAADKKGAFDKEDLLDFRQRNCESWASQYHTRVVETYEDICQKMKSATKCLKAYAPEYSSPNEYEETSVGTDHAVNPVQVGWQ